jgi:transcriptional regulator with XRE-family HTH domain
MQGFLVDCSEAENSLFGEPLREAREIAGFTRTALERCAGLAVGRLARVERGRARFRAREWAAVRSLLFGAMVDRAREISRYVSAGEPAGTEGDAAADHHG